MSFLKDEDYKEQYFIIYPDNWEVAYAQEGAIVHYISPLEGPGDRFRENLSISKQNLESDIILENFIAEQLLALEQSLLDFKLLDKSKTKRSSREAYQIIFSGKSENLILQFIQVYLLIFSSMRKRLKK